MTGALPPSWRKADATETERGVTEINTGILAAPATSLKRLLAGLGNDNAQGEFYLTDIVAAAQSAGVPVSGHQGGVVR